MGSVPEEQDMYSYTSPTKVKGQNVPTSMLPYATAKTSRFVVKNNKTLHHLLSFTLIELFGSELSPKQQSVK